MGFNFLIGIKSGSTTYDESQDKKIVNLFFIKYNLLYAFSNSLQGLVDLKDDYHQLTPNPEPDRTKNYD